MKNKKLKTVILVILIIINISLFIGEQYLITLIQQNGCCIKCQCLIYNDSTDIILIRKLVHNSLICINIITFSYILYLLIDYFKRRKKWQKKKS